MDIFTLHDNGTTYARGEAINGLISKEWVERYAGAGEFTLVCDPSEKIMDQLELDTLISHTDTQTIMIVENHEIKETKGKAPVLTITGRSMEAFFEQRAATDLYMGFSPSLYDGSQFPYFFPNMRPWEQVVDIIRQHVQNGYAIRSDFVLPHVAVTHEVTESGVRQDRDAERGDLYSVVQNLLAEFDAGIKIERPSELHDNIKVIVHKGRDRTDKVRFTYAGGDLEDARYFRSNRRKKNSGFIAARFQGDYVDRAPSGTTGWKRRVMYIDASDIDVNPHDPDTAWAAASIAGGLETILEARANRKIKHHKRTRILEATVSPDAHAIFRKDYDIGDQVHVLGNYGISDTMRVTQYAETEDENGESGFPTLSPIEP